MKSGLIPIPTHVCVCKKCGESIYHFNESQITKCPKCGSDKIDSGPIVHGGPTPKPRD